MAGFKPAQSYDTRLTTESPWSTGEPPPLNTVLCLTKKGSVQLNDQLSKRKKICTNRERRALVRARLNKYGTNSQA